jgi:hypothetical protein
MRTSSLVTNRMLQLNTESRCGQLELLDALFIERALTLKYTAPYFIEKNRIIYNAVHLKC